MAKSLDSKVALITGGTTGIGRTTAVAFAQAGAKVVVTGRRQAEGEKTIQLVREAGGEGIFLPADVTKETDTQNAVAETVKRFGRLDVAFNNAGVEALGPITEVTESDYRKLFDVNVWGVLAAMKHEIPAMLKNGGGSIINTSSIAGHIGLSGASIYIATKHAVEGLTKTAAIEFAKQGIRVNAVAPGLIATDMADRFAGKEGEMRDYFVSLHPLGRAGQPREISEAVVWLASEASSFVTGHSLVVDGGFIAQ